MDQGLPRRVVFDPCTKCGESDPSVTYISDMPIYITQDVALKRCQVQEGEHFHARCARCNFAWEALTDGSRA